jgi:hypothetical protein
MENQAHKQKWVLKKKLVPKHEMLFWICMWSLDEIIERKWLHPSEDFLKVFMLKYKFSDEELGSRTILATYTCNFF